MKNIELFLLPVGLVGLGSSRGLIWKVDVSFLVLGLLVFEVLIMGGGVGGLSLSEEGDSSWKMN